MIYTTTNSGMPEGGGWNQLHDFHLVQRKPGKSTTFNLRQLLFGAPTSNHPLLLLLKLNPKNDPFFSHPYSVHCFIV